MSVNLVFLLPRDKASKLGKAEQTIEKYSKKLEEMVVLKKQNKVCIGYAVQ